MRVSNVFIMYILFLSNHEHSIKSFPRRVPDCFVLYSITLHHQPLIHPGPERKPGERIFKKAISKQNKLSVILAFYSCVHFWLRYSWILPIECFHSRGQHLRKFIRTKESVCIRKEFNSHRTGLGHQHGRRFIVLGHQYGRRDVISFSCIIYVNMIIFSILFGPVMNLNRVKAVFWASQFAQHSFYLNTVYRAWFHESILLKGRPEKHLFS